MNDDLDTVLFHEQQRFREPFTWMVLLGASAFVMGTVVWMAMRQVVGDQPFGPEAMSNGALMGLGGTVVLLNLLYVLRYALGTLQTEVTYRGLLVRYWPRQQKVRKIDLAGVKEVSTVAYRPFIQYGGRGLRRQPRGTAYTVGGRHGVRLDYDNGAHVLIGTREHERLADAIRLVLGRELAAQRGERSE